MSLKMRTLALEGPNGFRQEHRRKHLELLGGPKGHQKSVASSAPNYASDLSKLLSDVTKEACQTLVLWPFS